MEKKQVARRGVLNFPPTLTTTTVVVVVLLLLLVLLLLVFLLQFSCVLFVREIGRISFLRNEPFREYVTTRFFLSLSFYKQRVFVRREVRVFARAGRGRRKKRGTGAASGTRGDDKILDVYYYKWY